MVNDLNNVVLTAQDDDFTSSDNDLGKVEGLKGNDQIILTGQPARQIDGDQGDDTLSGAEVIYGGAGNDMFGVLSAEDYYVSQPDFELPDGQIAGYTSGTAYGGIGDDRFDFTTPVAFGGDGRDEFYLTAGSYANGGSGGDTYWLSGEKLNASNTDYAVITGDTADASNPNKIFFDKQFSELTFSRITDTDSGSLTSAVHVDAGDDYDLVITDFFADGPNNEFSDLHYFASSQDFPNNIDEFFVTDIGAVGSIGLPLSSILADQAVASVGSTPSSVDETVSGSPVDDHLEGFDGDDRLFGFAGDDRLEGDAGDDRVFGGVGDDVLFGGAGDNRLDGGSGNDVIHARGDTDTVWGDKGSDVIYANADQTIIALEGIGDYAAEDEVDEVHGFDVGVDMVMIENGNFDQSGAVDFLVQNGSIDGTNLVLDLGDGRTIKLIDVVDEDDPEEVSEFSSIFVL